MSDSNDKQPSLDDLLNDPAYDFIDIDPSTNKTRAQASSDTPLLLVKYAEKLGVNSFNGVPPMHGVDIEEVLNTSIIRRFYSQTDEADFFDEKLLATSIIPAKEHLNSEFEKQASIAKSSVEENAQPAKKRNSKTQKLASTPAKTVDDAITINEDSVPTISNHELTPIQEDDVTLIAEASSPSNTIDPSEPITPYQYLMTANISPEQKKSFLQVHEFLSLHHRLPVHSKNNIEKNVAESLDMLKADLPKPCTDLLQYFLPVMPETDVKVIQEQFLMQNTSEESQSEDNQPTNKQNVETAPAEQALSKGEENAEDCSLENNSSNVSFDSVLDAYAELGIFEDLQEVPTLKKPDYQVYTPTKQSSSVDGMVARQKPCKNFDQYQWIFTKIKEGLKQYEDASGNITSDLALEPLRGEGADRSINIGDVFLSQGTYYLVANIGQDAKTFKTKHSTKGQARIHVITDSGMESNPFDSSFRARFDTFQDSRRVIDVTNKGYNLMQQIRTKCFDWLRDIPTQGYIYIVRTKSTDPLILDYQKSSELIKIGYTTSEVEKRLANASKETTFLEAPVELLAKLECKNHDPVAVEKLIHHVLNIRRLNIMLKSSSGKEYYPEEWFTISLEVALDVVKRILDGSIVKYRLNPLTGTLVEKELK